MTLSRALPLALMLVGWPLAAAYAQFGGMPGMPAGPGMPGMAGPGFGAPQQGPPPVCQQLMGYRDETAKHGQALAAAGKKKAGPEEVCKLFKAFVAAETKFVKSLEENSEPCHVPADVIKQIRLAHGKASETAQKVCEAAARGPQPTGPSLSDALGSTPTVPDASSARGQGTFDTLMGSPLAR
jgi:hypothetical protein